MFYAHSSYKGNGERNRETWEPLHEHLTLVSERAARYAAEFGAADEARLAGLLHDIGKYSELFTKRLENKTSGLDHWSIGAWIAVKEHNCPDAALAIQGHHVGLQKRTGLRSLRPSELAEAKRRPTELDTALLVKRAVEDGILFPSLPATNPVEPTGPVGEMLDVRMLFSALVDADFIETEAHFHRSVHGQRQYRADEVALTPESSLVNLNAYVESLDSTNSTINVRLVRQLLFEECHEAGRSPTGTYTLAAPTGSGKTLSALAFALRHAAIHNKRRIVVAMPYLSIIEQTARVYREALQPTTENYVLEHHSLMTPEPKEDEEEANASRLLAENWDAPIVLTTSVQLLESLFANRPSRCRKLHRLANSIVILDEVQTLPAHLAVFTLAAMRALADSYSTTVVFATATQPAFNHLNKFVEPWDRRGWNGVPLIATSSRLFTMRRRIQVEWAHREPTDWKTLAQAVEDHKQVLVIVNIKRHAAHLADIMGVHERDDVLHLSTNMCPSHRINVLGNVRRRIRDNLPCKLISTQCVEAGVDLDFPVVYRALAPFDALVQAAGRCDRNGRREGAGRLVVFLPEQEGNENLYPGGTYRQAAQITQTLLDSHQDADLDLEDPAWSDRYYRQLYDTAGIGSDQSKKERCIAGGIKGGDYLETAKQYRLIKDDTVNVLVPYDPAVFDALVNESENSRYVVRAWTRKAQQHAVAVLRTKIRDFSVIAAPIGGTEKSQEWFILQGGDYYSDVLGLTDSDVVLTV